MLIVSTTGAHAIGDEHESDDGIFEVPSELGEHLVSFPGWRLPTEDELADRDAEPPAPAKRTRARKS